MDPAAVALLAAGIPALVAALTFATTQIIRLVSERRSRRREALLALLGALEELTPKTTTGGPSHDEALVILKIMNAAGRLIIVLPKRDYTLWEWAQVSVNDMLGGTGESRTTIAGTVVARIMLYLRSPRLVRRMFPAMQKDIDASDLIEK